MRTSWILLLLAAASHAESWEPLEQYVRSCTRIVKARAGGKKDREIRFKLIECWKGKPLSKDEEYLTYPGEHGVPEKGADEIVFFFTKEGRHSTSFPVVNGRVQYAATHDADALAAKPLRRWYSVAEFKERVEILQLPMAATADKRFRLQSRGFPKGAAGTPYEFEVERAGSPWYGSEVYFDEEQTQVEAIVDGKPVEGLRAHASIWPTWSPRIEVYGLAAGSKVDRLVVVCPVIHVVASKAYDFEKLAMGKSAEFSAPPFTFRVESDAKEAMIVCGLVRDAKLRALEKTLDSQAITPMWAANALYLLDDKFRYLAPLGGAGNHRGFALGFALSDPPGAPLQFPLSLSIRIPTKIKKERLRFEFHDFKLAR